MSKWRPAETAPKKVTTRLRNIFGNYSDEYGQLILGYPTATTGAIGVVRWWQPSDDDRGNFIDDGGNACRLTHWMPLPKEPTHD